MGPNHNAKAIRVYQITLAGRLDCRWCDWFGDMAVSVSQAPDGTAVTTLSGVAADQATLRGILNKIWDLNLTLMSLICTEQVDG